MRDGIMDAHAHIQLQSGAPVKDLLEEFAAHGVSGGVLIVNTKEELNAVWRDLDALKRAGGRIHVVSGLSLLEENPFEIYERFSSEGIRSSIKLHPKLFHYQKTDFPAIAEALAHTVCENVVIDALYFGAQLEYHVGIELGIFLARRFPDKRFILAHAGGIRLLDCQMFTRELENIYYDLSFTASYLNHTSVRLDMVNFIRHTDKRILFGSDYPSFDLTRAEESFRELCEEAGLSSEQKENVWRKNAEKIYGICGSSPES